MDKTYIIKENIISGYIPNTGKANILFKKGDVVSGTVVSRFVFNQFMQGIEVKPTVSGAHIETFDGKHFIPLSNLDTITNGVIVNARNNPDNSRLINAELSIPSNKPNNGGVFSPSIVSPNDPRFQPKTEGTPLPEKKPIGLIVGLVIFLGALYYFSKGETA